MENNVVVKTIKKSYDDDIKAGITWFKFIAAINDIKLTTRELELLAFINRRGTISSLQSKEEFCNLFGSSQGTVANMTSRLLKLRMLSKNGSNKIHVNPALKVDFNNPFVVRFFIDIKPISIDGN